MVGILFDDWSVRLGDNRPDQSFHTFGDYAATDKYGISKNYFQLESSASVIQIMK